QTALQWQKVFFVTSGILFFFGILYLIYGEANVQPWNNKLKEQRSCELDQLEKLKSDENDEKSKEMSVIKNNNV
ncbi:hypothetical protein LSTR_LSTR015945, partial [Laodelphax striatellus]